MATIIWEDAPASPPSPRTPNIVWEDAPQPAPVETPTPPSSSLGYTAGVAAGFNPPVSDTDKSVANVRGALARAPGVVAAWPHSLAHVADTLIGKEEPGWVQRNTPSPEWVTEALMGAGNAVGTKLGLPQQQPIYKPETMPGQIAQDVLAGAPTAALGGGGLIPFVSRQIGNLAGATAGNVAQSEMPDSPRAQMAAGLLSSILAPWAVGKTVPNLKHTTEVLSAKPGTPRYENKVEATANNRVNLGEPQYGPGEKLMNQAVNLGSGLAGGYLASKAAPYLPIPHLDTVSPFMPLAGGALSLTKQWIPKRLEKFEADVAAKEAQIRATPYPWPNAGAGRDEWMTFIDNMKQFRANGNQRPVMPPMEYLGLFDPKYYGQRATGYAAPFGTVDY